MTVGVAEAGEGVEKEHHLVHHGRVGRRERVGRLLGKRLAKALEPPRLLRPVRGNRGGQLQRGLPLPHKDIAKGRSKALVGQGRRPPPIVSCSQIPTAATADRLHTPAVPLKFHDRLTRLRTTLLHEKKWPDRATSCTRVSAGGRGRWGSPTGRAPWRCPPCPPRSRRNHRPSRSTAGRRRAQRPRQWRGRPATRGAPPGQNPTVGCRGRRHRRRRVV